MSTSPRVVVIGGGIAGLLAARRHARAGAQVTLLEADEQLGGALRCTDVAGITVNAGAEAYSTRTGAVDALIEELGLADQIRSPRAGLSSRLVSAAGTHVAPVGGMLGIPGHPFSASTRTVIGWRGALRTLVDRVLPGRIGLRPGVTLGQLVRLRMGRSVTDRLVAPLVGGVHSADPDTVEVASIMPTLPEDLRRHGSLQAVVRARRSGTRTGSAPRHGSASGTPRSAGTAVHSLAPTMSALTDAIAQDLQAHGGQILTGAPATSITRQADGSSWTVYTGDTQLAADHLVLACPPDAAHDLLHAPVPEVAAAIAPEPAVPVRLVALVLEDRRLDAFPVGTGALVAPGTPGIRAKALTHASAKWEHVQSAAGTAHVVRLSYGRPGEELPSVDDAPTLALADASAILGVPLREADLRGSQVITWERTMRGASPGRSDRLAELEAALEDEPNLELVGAWRAGTGIEMIVRADAAAVHADTPAAAARAADTAPANTPAPSGPHTASHTIPSSYTTTASEDRP